MKIRIADLEDAFMFASAGAVVDAAAYLDRETGEFRYVGEGGDEPKGVVVELAGSARYLAVPNKYDLDLGQALIFDFVADQLPEAQEEVQAIFRHRGAYPRFKDLLDERDQLDLWYDYERRRTLEVLRDWAAGEGIELVD
ncbi:UPF0158 family protein [uncultured Thiodictyon sp.]|uniref:UPF0158 family protein n=1 Tax=uncultured Thiodictyon sp. TaxID=1846217 RepID=UPI0025DE24A8|nr:UPF0158 family protein [uncultured Thiodictyon sp.]